MISFPFRHAPDWFSNYIVTTHMDNFHDLAKCYNNITTDRDVLLEVSKKYFSEQGFNVKVCENQLWFELDDSLPEISFLALKWS